MRSTCPLSSTIWAVTLAVVCVACQAHESGDDGTAARASRDLLAAFDDIGRREQVRYGVGDIEALVTLSLAASSDGAIGMRTVDLLRRDRRTVSVGGRPGVSVAAVSELALEVYSLSCAATGYVGLFDGSVDEQEERRWDDIESAIREGRLGTDR